VKNLQDYPPNRGAKAQPDGVIYSFAEEPDGPEQFTRLLIKFDWHCQAGNRMANSSI
jgi:hypothetical protein